MTDGFASTLPGVTRAVLAGLYYFAIIFVAGFALGTARVLVLVPRFGESSAVLIELPVMLAVSWLACRWTITRLKVPTTLDARLLMGGLAFAVLMVAEAGISVLAFGRTLADHLDACRQTPGLLGLAAQIAFAAFPMVQRMTDK